MKWYRRVTAGNRDDYLRSLGAGDDVIAFINSQPPHAQQFFVNAFRQNPRMTVPQLSVLSAPQPVDPYSGWEHQQSKALGPNPQYIQWALVQLKKHRKGKNNSGIRGYDYTYDFRLPQFAGDHDYRNDINRRLREVKDWAQSHNISLPQYTLEQAVAASDAWHEALAQQQGTGITYQEKNIIYGPEWKNPKWRGWTIQEVRTKNDLAVEGEKMGHCVGGNGDGGADYCTQVANNETRIVSLRDPQNEPHATIELDPTGVEARQIRGKGNKDPIPQYQHMIEEWVSGGNGPKVNMESGDILQEISNARWDEVDQVLRRYATEYDVYGMNLKMDADIDDVFDSVLKALNRNGSDDGYYSWMNQDAKALVELAISHKKTKELENHLYKLENTLTDSLLDWDTGDPFPHKEDYPTLDEYMQARELWENQQQQQIDDHMNEHLPYAFVNDCFRFLNAYNEEQQKAQQPNVQGVEVAA